MTPPVRDFARSSEFRGGLGLLLAAVMRVDFLMV